MKKILFVAVASALLTSCGESFVSNKLADQKGLDEAKTILAKEHFAGKDFFEVDLETKEALNADFEEIDVVYFDPKINNRVSQSFSKKTGFSDPKPVNYVNPNSKDQTFKLEEIDFAYTLQKANQALAEIAKEATEYEDFNISSIKFAKKSDKINIEYVIDFTKKGEGTQRQGRRIVTNYYQMRAKVLEDGTFEFIQN